MSQFKLLIGAVLAITTSFGVAAEEPVELERALVHQAPALIKAFHEKGYQNVGVLKFLAVKEGGELSDNVGTLNTLMAQRLEMALLLANRPKNPVGILENASAVAQQIPGASHLGKENRKKFFEAEYPLFWGTQKVQADAFLTGAVQISQDLKLLTISLLTFDRTENKLVSIAPDFLARNRPDQFAELGESFVLRGASEGGTETARKQESVRENQEQTALAAVQQVRTGQSVHPAQDPAAPLSLEIRYDGRRVPIDVHGGVAKVAEPQEGEMVEMVLRRGASRERLRAILKVNGENTLARQRLPDAACRGWVLEPNGPPIVVLGYQNDDETIEKFRVRSREESAAREIDYGGDVGMITLSVFREAVSKPVKPNLLDDESLDSHVIANLLHPKQRPDTFAALKASLLESANRGIIDGGDRFEGKIHGKIHQAQFNVEPVPVMSLAIVYYRPQRQP